MDAFISLASLGEKKKFAVSVSLLSAAVVGLETLAAEFGPSPLISSSNLY
jgi:hypothetical protein